MCSKSLKYFPLFNFTFLYFFIEVSGYIILFMFCIKISSSLNGIISLYLSRFYMIVFNWS